MILLIRESRVWLTYHVGGRVDRSCVTLVESTEEGVELASR